MPTYTASRLSSEGNALYPDKLAINPMHVIYYKAALLGYQTTTIARRNIASVHASAGILFADVVIASHGGQMIIARGFTKPMAREIVTFLTTQDYIN